MFYKNKIITSFNGVVIMSKKRTSLNIEEKLLKGLKYIAYKEETTQTAILEKYISSGLKLDGVNVDEL